MLRPCIQRPVAVSREFRSLVLATYPVLITHPCREIYLHLVQHILFSPFLDEETGDLVVPCELVAAAVGIGPHHGGFRAGAWLEQFSLDVLPLTVSEYCYSDKKARTVAADIHPVIRTALDQQLHKSGDRVFFVTGEPVSRRARQQVEADYEQRQRMGGDAPLDHPAADLLHYLSERPQKALRNLLQRNEPLVRAGVDGLPTATPRQQRSRAWCQSMVDCPELWCGIYYRSTERSPRIFAAGASVNYLPSELRRYAFAGAVELDLRAAQLAIVSRLWDIPSLREALEAALHPPEGEERSIWRELADWMRVTAEDKPILKRTIYSLVFGMQRKKLIRQLEQGNFLAEGVGPKAARRFFRHPIVRDLLAARKAQLKRIKEAGGGEDAFGRWIPVTAAQKHRSVLAQIVQSWELKLMLAALPIIRSEPRVVLLAWLHDGVTLHFGDKSKQARQIRKLERAVKRAAAELGFPTELEVKHLPVPAIEATEHDNSTLRRAA